MHSLTTVSKPKSIFARHFILTGIILLLLLAGCSGELPDETEQGDDITLATKIEREAANHRVNNLVRVASWDNTARRLRVNGLNVEGPIAISNAATGQFIGAAELDDDDDDDRSPNLIFNNITAIPCSIRVQVNGDDDDDDDDERPRFQVIPVQNAPANCNGITATPAASDLQVNIARWNASANKLVVRGAGAFPRELVSVFDAITGQLLGTDQSDAIGRWKIKARNLVLAPCAVSIVASNQNVQANVDNSPDICSNAPIFNNPGNTGFNQAPDGVILGPIADMAINVGSSVNFFGTGFDPDGNTSLSYRWSFDNSSIPDSLQQNTSVTFTSAGVYRVTLYVTDSAGLVDPTPDTRVIVVQPNVITNQAPSGQILSPTNNVVINAGQSVYFSGTGFTPASGGVVNNLRFIWNFAGGAPNSTLSTPGNIIFGTPGVYLVSLTVVDSNGIADPTPEMVTVTVRGGNTGAPGSPGTPNNPSNLAPDGEIIDPVSDISIGVGESISFMGTAYDPDNSGHLRYRWDFGSLAPASTVLNPAPITFTRAGVYVVSFTVTDSLGAADPTPSVRTITVGDSAGNQKPNAFIVSPATNQTINTGQSIDFSGLGLDPDNNLPLSYRWDFAGAAAPSTLENPGPVIFNNPGTYTITLTVTDRLGASDFTPDTRVITVIDSGSSNNPGSNFVNQAPESQINSPSTDLIINVGDVVDFTAFGSDPENNSPLMYSWSFDGAVPDMLVQNPGEILFTRQGSYRVRLTVIDSNGNADETPAERMITVRNTIGGPNITEPTGTIIQPATSETINVGDFINFSGMGTDANGNGNSLLSYEWDFSGAAPITNLQNPGSIQFNETGIYKVTFYVKNNLGFYDSTPDIRFITVQVVPNENQAPDAIIISPATDLAIDIGDSISFIGAGQDPDNFGANLVYMWNFAGGASMPNSSLAAPGPVTFNTAGTYTVSLTVMDNFGQTDATPAIRTIEVRDTSTNNAPVVTITNPSPLQSNVISVGQFLSFSATATDQDPQDNTGISYEWNFDGAAPDSNGQNPGQIPFYRAGTYRVSVVAIDARGKRSLPAAVTVNVQGSGTINTTAPEAVILTPSNNVNLIVGDTISFQGSATSSVNSSLFYRWNFDGAAPSSFAQNPGNVTFNKVGIYNVQFTATDSTGATDLSPAMRTITVVSQNNTSPGSNTGSRPLVNITSPTNAVTNINVGGSVNFRVDGTDPDNNLPLSYRWTFGNGMPDQFVQNPGTVTFFQAGTYFVTVTVTDNQGNSTVATKTIVVGGGGNGLPGNSINSGAPNGIINAPATEVTISRGQSVYFAGGAIDPEGDVNINYSWNYAGGAVNSTQKTPGDVIFNTPGTFKVTLTVTDSTGMVDQTPASVYVTVF